MGENFFVSIIIPCLNEEKYLSKCLDSVLAQDYPKDFYEILVADGMSTDNTRAIMIDYASRFPSVRWFENPDRILPSGLNILIHEAKGDLIVRLDAHSWIPPEFVSKCVKYLVEFNVDCVGGVLKSSAGADTLIAKSISYMLSSFLGVGGSRFRRGVKRPVFVDTVPLACYHRRVFNKIGFFNEKMIRNEDIEFNSRLKKSKGKILLHPDIWACYFSRSDILSFLRQKFQDGFWCVYGRSVAQGRSSYLYHLLPMAFVSVVFLSFLLGAWFSFFLYIGLVILTFYSICVVISSLWISVRQGIKYWPCLIFIYFALHCLYGIGSLWGAFSLILQKKNKSTNGERVESINQISRGVQEKAGKGSNLFVSIIIPCRNEEEYISECLDSILSQDYPREMFEILVVEGMSVDRTVEIVSEYSGRFSLIRLLNNPHKILPTALNIGIRNAKGDVVVRLDAHAKYPNKYISQCVQALEEYAVDAVGGCLITRPQRTNTLGEAISFVLFSKFGVGDSLFRVGVRSPIAVDTVPSACYRREVFDRIGLFNENLVRNQDIEFNLRLKKAGGKIVLVPGIVSYYYARSTLKDLARNNFLNGFWVIYSMKFARLPFSIRHLVPFGFVLSLILSIVLAAVWPVFLLVFAGVLGLYLTFNLVISFSIAVKNGLRYLPAVVAAFLTLHFSYGLGSLCGLWKLLLPYRKNV